MHKENNYSTVDLLYLVILHEALRTQTCSTDQNALKRIQVLGGNCKYTFGDKMRETLQLKTEHCIFMSQYLKLYNPSRE